jgi:hypothetical protein
LGYLESTLNKELVIENVRAIYWIVPKKYLLLVNRKKYVKNQNLSNQLDSLKDTNSRLIDYAKSINKKVGTANSGKEFRNNKSLIFCLSSSGNLGMKICWATD